ncbi:MAG: transporter substrate-binding domain-containing protein [Colwellia sp.]|nr:transporter substrate-binding domain-containing protein [Colwellia sp.]
MKFFIPLILLLSIAGSAYGKKQPFIWVDDQDYEPYIYFNSNMQVAGIFHEIMTAVFAKMDIPLSYQLYPWSRAQKLITIGRADGMITIPTKERLAYLVASDPIIQVGMKVHYNKSNTKRANIAKVSSLKELHSFVLIDYQGDGWAESNLRDYNVMWAPNYTSAVMMIAANRGDIFLDDPISIKYHIKKQIELNSVLGDKLLLIEQGEHVIFSAPHCLMISKESTYLSILKEFNAALQAIKDNGEYDKIISKYIN